VRGGNATASSIPALIGEFSFMGNADELFDVFEAWCESLRTLPRELC
jgi:hypothetical protein